MERGKTRIRSIAAIVVNIEKKGENKIQKF
jgi:hypothetical protein